jgi:hypothetical protein
VHLSANPTFVQLSWWTVVLLILQFLLFILVLLKIKALALWKQRSTLAQMANDSLRYGTSTHTGDYLKYTASPPSNSLFTVKQSYSGHPIHAQIVNRIARKIDAMGETRLGLYLEKAVFNNDTQSKYNY